MFYAIGVKKLFRRLLALALLTIIVGCVIFRIRYPLKHIDLIETYARLNQLEPSLVCAIIHAESRFNNMAVSRKGASGLMQISRSTAEWMAEEIGLEDFDYTQIFEPEINIKIGTYYIKKLIDIYGSIPTALAAYNAGSGNVSKWLKDTSYSYDGVNLYHIPFLETRNYIERVHRNQKIYGYIIKYTAMSRKEVRTSKRAGFALRNDGRFFGGLHD